MTGHYSQTRVCENCGAEIVMEDPRIGWVTVMSEDDGGTVDYCPEVRQFAAHNPL